MTTTFIKTSGQLSVTKTILYTLACILLFVLIAIICGLLTFWIPFDVPRMAIREILLRTPLTIYALHLFARKVIKAYDPMAIYGRLSIINTLKWALIGLVLPACVWLFYYCLHFIVPFERTIVLASSVKLAIITKWAAISITAGLTEEVMFRGHLFMIISNRFSKLQAIFFSSLVFGLVHIMMLTSFNAVDILMVVGGGIIAGTMFSFIYQYTKVIWYAGIVHVVWDIFFIGKIIAISPTQTDANNTIMPFKLTTHSILLTGGNFGLEAALPCLLVYLLVILLLFGSGKKPRLVIGSTKTAMIH